MEHCPPWRALRQTALSPSAGPKNERSCHCLYSYLTLFGPQPYLALWGSGADWGCFSEERPRMEHRPPQRALRQTALSLSAGPKNERSCHCLHSYLTLFGPQPYPALWVSEADWG